MGRRQWIETTLRQAFTPQVLTVEDEGALHVGHAEARGGGHFRVLIVSDAFTGQTPVARHSAVYAALGDAMKADIHALALRTLTPDEWERAQPKR